MTFLNWLLSRSIWPIFRARGETTTWSERWYGSEDATPVDIWIHTSSIGEITPYATLLNELADRQLIGVTVTSGRGIGLVRERLDTRIQVRALPIPRGPGLSGLVGDWQPKRTILLEAEAWPALIKLALHSGDLAVLGGRIRFPVNRYWRHLARSTDAIAGIWVGSERAARGYLAAGIRPDRVHTGFAAKLIDAAATPLDPRFSDWDASRNQTVVAGSIHPGEAPILASAWTRVLASHPDARLIVVPRHIDRTESIASAFKQNVARWPQTDTVTIISQMGVLAGIYSLGKIALVGGSWVNRGGHTPVEPLLHDASVLMGPYRRNQSDLIGLLPGDFVFEARSPRILSERIIEILSSDVRIDRRSTLVSLSTQMSQTAREALTIG